MTGYAFPEHGFRMSCASWRRLSERGRTICSTTHLRCCAMNREGVGPAVGSTSCTRRGRHRLRGQRAPGRAVGESQGGSRFLLDGGSRGSTGGRRFRREGASQTAGSSCCRILILRVRIAIGSDVAAEGSDVAEPILGSTASLGAIA